MDKTFFFKCEERNENENEQCDDKKEEVRSHVTAFSVWAQMDLWEIGLVHLLHARTKHSNGGVFANTWPNSITFLQKQCGCFSQIPTSH